MLSLKARLMFRNILVPFSAWYCLIQKNYTCGIIQHCANYLICYMIKLLHYFSILIPIWTYARRNALRGKRYCLFLFFLFFQLFWWQHSRDGVVSQKNLTFHITFHVTRRRTLTRIIKCKKRENTYIIFFLPTYI